MSWQQHVADVALEIDPDTGRLVYRDVRLTVPRQSGKTTLVLPVVVWRAFAAEHLGGRQNMVYAAQTRQKARKKWERDYVFALRSCRPMRGKFEVRLANGDERVTFRGGSTFGVEATTEKAGHGETLDMPIQDEAFALVDDRMDQAFRPPMITRPSPQFWITSTAGTASSLYLRRKVDEGRAAVETGLDHGVAYFEWSADPDVDPADPATWWSCMPALGHTVTEDAIRGELAGMDRTEFARAYLNLWSDEVVQTVIPLSWWTDRSDRDATITGRPVLAIDVAPMGTWASVLLAGTSSTVADAVHLEVLASREGTDWIVDLVAGVCDRRDVRAVALDDVGPAGSLVQPLRARGIEVLVIGARGLVQACGGLYDAVRDDGITHLGDEILTDAIKAAATRQLGDAWAWKRRTSTGDITALVAATIARWAHFEAPLEDIVPLVAWR
jgi:phage terminase large subunit-like protein